LYDILPDTIAYPAEEPLEFSRRQCQIHIIILSRTHKNVKVNVCFETLTANDADILKGEDWQGSRFGEVWKELAELEAA